MLQQISSCFVHIIKAKQLNETLLQHRYEIILFPNYFIIVVCYYCTRPVLFLSPSLPFSFSNFFHYCFFLIF